MTIRERLEQQEYMLLAPNAQKAAETKGRLYPAEENEVRTCYQRDADRIVHSKSFRRLMHKTQVFLSPEGDHYRTRMTHTLEVSRIARTICRALRLNEDLAEAAAYGHDLGHTPFGHAGEAALTDMMGTPFHHNEQSLRVVDKLERDGDGLNLTYEVRMAILGHTGSRIPETLEGQVVRTSDRIAYINHDIDDAVRGGIIRESDIPAHLRTRLGASHGTRIDTLVTAMIDYGQKFCEIGMEQGIHDDMMELLSTVKPDAVAVEELFWGHNVTTGIGVSHGRGVILLAIEKYGAPLFEYTPNQVKQAVVGYGGAEKRQVMDMTRRILKMEKVARPDDAADAIAIALCHARSATSLLSRVQET